MRTPTFFTMTTKQVSLVLAISVFVGVAAFRLGAQQDAAPVGTARYVLVPSEFQTSVNNTRMSERSLFKIDTATGKTWRFVSRVDDKGNLNIYWDPSDDLQPRR